MRKVCLAGRRPATVRTGRVHQETTGLVYGGGRIRFATTGVRARPSPVASPPFKKLMVTIANASLLSDLELQREQELAEARAIQVGMLPQGALRTADAAICYSFHPFMKWAATFWIFSY
jgi:hypothetical protein